MNNRKIFSVAMLDLDFHNTYEDSYLQRAIFWGCKDSPQIFYDRMMTNTEFFQRQWIFPWYHQACSWIKSWKDLKQKYLKRKVERFLEMNLCFQKKDLSALQVNGSMLWGWACIRAGLLSPGSYMLPGSEFWFGSNFCSS